MQANDVCLALFPFGGTTGRKLRPVLVLTPPVGAVPEVLVAYMSSIVPNALLPSDVVLDPAQQEHSTTGLAVRSVVRLHKLATVHGRDIVRRLGHIPPATAADVAAKLRAPCKQPLPNPTRVGVGFDVRP